MAQDVRPRYAERFPGVYALSAPVAVLAPGVVSDPTPAAAPGAAGPAPAASDLPVVSDPAAGAAVAGTQGPATPETAPHRTAAERDAEHAAELDALRADLVEEARSWGRRVRRMGALARLSEAGALDGVPQFAQLELAGTCQVSQLTATRWQDDAERLETCLPLTLEALEAGTLLVHQAQVLLHRTRHCPQPVARDVEAEVLPAAAALCPADLRKRVDLVVLRIESEQLDAAAAEQRHTEAAADRRTFTRSEVDGMGMAGAVLTAEQLVGWQAGLDQLERRERLADRDAGVERTADQRRADLFAALPAMVLAGTAQAGCGPAGRGAFAAPGAPGAPWTLGPEQLAAHVVLNVLVPVSTVLDLSREPGSLGRYGPISAEHVRLVRPHSYRRVLVDATSGRPIAVDDRTTPVDPDPHAARQQVLDMLRPDVITDADEPQHDPSAHLARLVDVRDVHCCGPGCSSTRTDRDHLIAYPEGPTSARNLGRLSRRCHLAKHHGWALARHLDGSTTWTSPLARPYSRPGPHQPPPEVDLFQPLPPLRRRPTVTAVPVDGAVRTACVEPPGRAV